MSAVYLRNEHRFLGLYTANAYAADPVTIPIIRRKVDFVLANSGYAENSHEASELLRVLQVYPRDELFQSHSEFLLKTSVAIHQIQERRQTRVFLRTDLRNGFCFLSGLYASRGLSNRVAAESSGSALR